MPLHNLIQGRRFDSVIRRLFAIKQANAVPTVEPSLMGTVEVQDFEPEMYFLREEKLCFATTIEGAGGAGTFAHSVLFNGQPNEVPPGQLVTIVDRILIGSGTLTPVTFDVRIDASSTGTEQGVKGVRDTRWVPNATSVSPGAVTTRLFSDNTQLALFGNLIARMRTSAEVNFVVWEGPVVLGLNQGLYVFAATANTPLDVFFTFRERVTLPDETPRS